MTDTPVSDATPEPAVPSDPPGLTDFLAGLFLGVLVGGLVGLSVSPLAGDVLAGLIALLAAFFGLGGKIPGAGTGGAVTKIRLLAFCVGVVVAVPGSIMIRTNGMLAPTLAQRVADYKGADLAEPLAKELAVFDHTGLRIGSLSSVPDPTPNQQNESVAFSAATAADCSALQEAFFDNAPARLAAMAKADAPWAKAGGFGLVLPPDQQGAFATYIHDTLCDPAE